MAYSFSLETLLNYRRSLEEQAQIELARELLILENHRARLGELRNSRQQTMNDFGARKDEGLAGAMYAYYTDFIQYMEREIEIQLNTIESHKLVVDQRRMVLLDKVKNRKIIERAKEKDFQAYRKEQQKKELKESDEHVILIGSRNGLQSA